MKNRNVPISVGVLTVSDTRSAGRRADTTTPLVRRLLEEAGFAVGITLLVPDELQQIQARLIELTDTQQLALVLTTGGTGLGSRDVTPEATRRVLEREVPGLAEAMRASSAGRNPLAWLSLGLAGLRGETLIVNLPGSPQAVEECLRVLLPVLPHALEMVEGRGHDPTTCLSQRQDARLQRRSLRARRVGDLATTRATRRAPACEAPVIRTKRRAGPGRGPAGGPKQVVG